MTDYLIPASINEKVKNEASEVLAGMGLTISDAFSILLSKVATEKNFPFDLRTPNAETLAAITELKSGGGTVSNDTDELFRDLGL